MEIHELRPDLHLMESNLVQSEISDDQIAADLA